MPTHAEKRRIRYPASQMFDLVADIEQYPEFLPWCQNTRIRKRETLDDGRVALSALMSIGFKGLSDSFTTEAVLSPPGRIDVLYKDGPFIYLNSHWVFEPAIDGDGREVCDIDFFIDFEFRSGLFQKAVQAVFSEAVKRMIAAFERRARQLNRKSRIRR